MWQTGMIVAISGLFWIWPGLDIWVSELFFRPGAGFWLAEVSILTTVRYLIFVLPFAVAALALVMIVVQGNLLWSRILALHVLGPVVVVNWILKNFWHRPRPEDITEFGGMFEFTRVWQIAGECSRDCSFVSGEAAGVAAAAIAITTLSPRIWPFAVVLLILGAGLRVAMGGHFLSDVVLAVLMMALVAQLLGLKKQRETQS